MISVNEIVRAICTWNFSSEQRPKEVEEVLLSASEIMEENIKLKKEVESAMSIVQGVAKTSRSEVRDLLYALEVITPYAAKSRISGIDSALELANNTINKAKGLK